MSAQSARFTLEQIQNTEEKGINKRAEIVIPINWYPKSLAQVPPPLACPYHWYISLTGVDLKAASFSRRIGWSDAPGRVSSREEEACPVAGTALKGVAGSVGCTFDGRSGNCAFAGGWAAWLFKVSSSSSFSVMVRISCCLLQLRWRRLRCKN